MARHETDGNIITDKATGLQWVKNPRLILPGFTGSLGQIRGWQIGQEFPARDFMAIPSSQQFATGQAIFENAITLRVKADYKQVPLQPEQTRRQHDEARRFLNYVLQKAYIRGN